MIVRSEIIDSFKDLYSIIDGIKGEDGVEIRMDHMPSVFLDFKVIKNYSGFKLLTLKNEASDLVIKYPEIIEFFDLVDLDHDFYKSNKDKLRETEKKLMLSIHSSSLEDIVNFVKESKGKFKKLKAVLNDGKLCDFIEGRKLLGNGDDITFFLTGDENKITRLYGIRGKGINYSYVKNQTAPGQFSLKEAIEIRDKDVYGLVGNPLSKSVSSKIYRKIFNKHKINATYLNFEIKKDQIHHFIQIARELGIKGLNFTIPFKTEAANILAGGNNPINFVKFGDKDEVRNTDLEALIELTNKFSKEKILIYGNGASALTAIMAFHHSEIYVTGRNIEHVHKFAAENNIKVLMERGKFDILVNATPVGMYENSAIPNIIGESKFDVIVDFPYSFSKTTFEKLAESQGSQYISGLEMLAKQASFNLKYWFKKEIGDGEILEILMGCRNEGN